jgi:hypothetical protein
VERDWQVSGTRPDKKQIGQSLKKEEDLKIN